MKNLDDEIVEKCIKVSDKTAESILRDIVEEGYSDRIKLEMALFTISVLSSNIVGFLCSSITNMSVDHAILKISDQFIKSFSRNMHDNRDIISEAKDKAEMISKKAH